MASPTTPSGGQTNLGLAPNVAGLLCYAPCCLGLIFSIVVAIVEKQSRFVRFHGFQSLLLHAVGIGLSIAIQIANVALAVLHVGLLGLVLSLVGMIVGFGLLVVSIICMIKAYGNEEYSLPTIGEMAKKWA
jgi:uncharacterized membrane protein